MKLTNCIIICITTLFTVSILHGKSNTIEKVENNILLNNSLKSLRLEIKNMIIQLNANTMDSSKKFIQRYAIPEDLEGMDGIDEVAKLFHNRKRERIIKVLRESAKIEPKISNDGKKYTFNFKNNKIDEVVFLWSMEEQQFYITMALF